MEVVTVLLPVALVLAILAVVGFLWAAKRGQFDDMETPAIRMLFDDEPRKRPSTSPPSPAKKPGAEIENRGHGVRTKPD